ncbi:multidrug DMT transporter permease [Burkholderia lata]|nr:multidrug DMT transporter permease [Burkholderia lata]
MAEYKRVRAAACGGPKKTAIPDNRCAPGGGIVGIPFHPFFRIVAAMNLSLYFVTVLIWGTTWIAIKWQLGSVPPPVSIAWRFWLAAAVLFALLRVMRRPVRPPREAWRFLLAQGFALFCLNFLCFYYAEQVVPSGLVAVIFSTAPLLNSINGRLFMGRPLRPSAIAGALLGLVGIACLFWQQMAGHLDDHATWTGLAIAFAGTMCFSAGNLLSSRMQSMGLHPLVTNGWAMLIGATILTVGSAVAGLPFTLDTSPRYLGALVYLAVPGSVIGFTAYLTLVGRIGPERAAYCTVLFPIVALAVSTVFEGYQWSPLAVVGLLLVVAGNLVAFDLTRRLFLRTA